MSEIAETEILEILEAKAGASGALKLLEAALGSTGIERKASYSAAEVLALGTAITEASYGLLEEALSQA